MIDRRRLGIGALALAANPAHAAGAFAPVPDEFARAAASAGLARATVEAALGGFTPDPKVIALTRRQSEFARPIGAYVGGAVSAARLDEGRRLAARWAGVQGEVERRDGVPGAVVLAIWAQESGFGRATGGFQTIRSLATLASIRYREDVFRPELIAALRILEEEHAPPGLLTGSWAGAMGQAQFMPSSFLAYAVDQDGDGRRDIWTSTPDVLASISNFLARHGWRRGLPWGCEVVLPQGLDLTLHARGMAEWSAMGVACADGAALPGGGSQSLGRLFLPAGIAGPAFLLTENWEVVRAYNTSDSYALAIGHLSDRLAGSGPLRRPWPAGPGLTQAEREEVHRDLARRGLYGGTPDGKFGAATRDAVRRFQIERGLVPDGYADRALLAALRVR